jgi:hypothetical protein
MNSEIVNDSIFPPHVKFNLFNVRPTVAEQVDFMLTDQKPLDKSLLNRIPERK